MKIYIYIIFVLIGSLFPSFATGFSDATNGVYLAVESWGKQQPSQITNEPFRFNDELVFLAYCNTGKVELQFHPDPAYFVKINMTSRDGKEVSKTFLGRRYGSKFEKLHVLDVPHVGILLAEGSYEQNNGQGMAKSFPSPQELFEMKEPGIYTMEIQMQMFLVHKNTNAWTRELIRFSPIKIHVEKPPEK